MEAKIEWVKTPSEEQRHFKYYTPKEKQEEEKNDLVALKWSDYSWEYPGWGDQLQTQGFQLQNGVMGYEGKFTQGQPWTRGSPVPLDA